MGPSDSWQFILLVILLMFSAFFSASETALMTLSKIRIRHLVEENVKGAQLIQKLVNNPSKLLGAILIGNNVVNIGASALMTAMAIAYFGEAGVGIATGVMTLIVLIFGEITPKSLAAQNSEKVSFLVAKPIALITFVLAPLINVLMVVTNAIIFLLGGKTGERQISITEDELKTIVNVSHEEGVLEIEERKMIHNVFEFGDTAAKDVMTPRTNMISIDVNSSYEETFELFKKEQFTRIPVFEDSFDNIVGIITIKDLVFDVSDPKEFDMRIHMRQPVFTFEFKPTADLLADMREVRAQMAIVLDEYGGTAGIVTVEDLIEEIVGEIVDEYDEVEKEIQVICEDEYVLDGSTKIEDVNEMIGMHLESEHFDTIGGYIIEIMGNLPEVGECIERNGIRFVIESVDKNRIESIRIYTGIQYTNKED